MTIFVFTLCLSPKNFKETNMNTLVFPRTSISLSVFLLRAKIESYSSSPLDNLAVELKRQTVVVLTARRKIAGGITISRLYRVDFSPISWTPARLVQLMVRDNRSAECATQFRFNGFDSSRAEYGSTTILGNAQHAVSDISRELAK